MIKKIAPKPKKPKAKAKQKDAESSSVEHEKEVRIRDEALNATTVTQLPKKGMTGIYLCRSDDEAISLIELFANHEQDQPLHIVINTTNPTDTLKAVAYAHNVQPKELQMPIWKKIEKEGKETEIPLLRDGYVWQVGKGIELAFATTPPKAAWTKDSYKSIAMQLSEFHDKELFTRMLKEYNTSEEAFKKARQIEGRSREKTELWRKARQGKEEIRSCLVGRLATLLGSNSTQEQMSVTVNRITIFEGKGRGTKSPTSGHHGPRNDRDDNEDKLGERRDIRIVLRFRH